MPRSVGREITRFPKRNEVWLHVDRLDKRDRTVWAIQYWEYSGITHGWVLVYRVAKHVYWSAQGETRFKDDGRQPRAFLEFQMSAVRWLSKHSARIY